jgi:dTMP kinase
MALVVIDGLDASGKTTQACWLRDFIVSRQKTVCLRLHPSTDNAFGAKAKHFLYGKGKNAHFAAALFYMVDVIRSVLLYSWRDYDYVIFVRYLMGTAYLPAPLDRIAYHFFSAVLPTSDLMFFLDVTPGEAVRRLQTRREQLEMFENVEELQETKKKAICLASLGGWKIVKAERTTKQVQEAIRRSIKPRLMASVQMHR